VNQFFGKKGVGDPTPGWGEGMWKHRENEKGGSTVARVKSSQQGKKENVMVIGKFISVRE